MKQKVKKSPHAMKGRLLLYRYTVYNCGEGRSNAIETHKEFYFEK
jgi:hypothetical protein